MSSRWPIASDPPPPDTLDGPHRTTKRPDPISKTQITKRRYNDMTFPEKIAAVRRAALRRHISGGNLPSGYWYGENPYADMLIENALMCDMFPEEVLDTENFYGFRRSDYALSRAE